MQNKSILSNSKALRSTLTIILAISLIFSGAFCKLALAEEGSNAADASEVQVSTDAESNDDASTDKADDKSTEVSNDAINEESEDTSEVAVLSADSVNDLPELKEDSWRYRDGQRIDQDLNVLPVLRSGMYDHSNVKSQGIDVSVWQGDIDWATAKNYVDFVIIRAGYGGNAYKYDDLKWQTNVEACERYGIPYGVYLYSYATSLDDAHSEADHLIRLLNGHRPTYPVYIDMEENKTINAGRDMLINIASTVCERIKAAGYTPGVYANKYWWTTYLNDSRFDSYERWVAQYNYRCDYQGDYRIWQYSSQGSVPGIAGYVDMNYDYGEISESEYELVYNYEYYRDNNSDLRAAYGDNRQAYFRHFIRWGMDEGRCGNALFSPSEYRDNYSDLQSAYGSEMRSYYKHFMSFGINENRRPNKNFEIASYFNGNDDLRKAFGGNWYRYYIHYAFFGYKENRIVSGAVSLLNPNTTYAGQNWENVFDYNYYINHNPDVKTAYTYGTMYGKELIDDTAVIRHFYEWGMKEGRRANENFNVISYYNAYDDLRSAYGHDVRSYYSHYCNYGKQEKRICSGNTKMYYRTKLNGIDYSGIFDGAYYAVKNPDVKAAFSFSLTRDDEKVVDDLAVLQHLITYGMNEKRKPSAKFDVVTYRNRYDDLDRAYGDNWAGYYYHYINFGISEGRIAI